MQPKCLEYTAIAVSHLLLTVLQYSITIGSGSLSLLHQCHTQQTPSHLRKISAKTRLSDIFDLDGLIISPPPLLKTRFIGELDVGILRARSAG